MLRFVKTHALRLSRTKNLHSAIATFPRFSADVPPEELQNIVDKACQAVRGEMRQEILKNGT
jgi:hypothetical protein